MKHINLVVVTLCLFFSSFTMADEGMWFLMNIERLNQRDMQKLGLQLTAEEIYSINNSSLKDAVVQFNGGCTAELISKDGLLLTNHHCGFGAIAELSSPENDYLTNGFWAKSRSEELKPKSLYVRFFVRMDACTKRINAKLNAKMTEEEREKAIDAEVALIEKENNDGGKYTVSVRSFFQGNEFYYFVYQDYTDVRLVGTPPNSIGKFGGDTDNWEWPRHTGDFSMFRVYADANGNPAEYSTSNVPLHPKQHLKVNIGGVKENDFAMILGYPGRTNRWMPAGGISQNVNYAYPAWVESSKLAMDRMKVYMDKDDNVRLNYASTYASVANYWKNRQGMIDALTKAKTAEEKAAKEASFNIWANKRKNKETYGTVIETINKYYEATNLKARHDNYLIGLIRTAKLTVIPYRLERTVHGFMHVPDSSKEEALKEIIIQIEGMYSELHMALEQDILAYQLGLYASKGNESGLSPMVAELAGKNKNDFTAFVKDAFAKSIFGSQEQLIAFLNNPSEEILENDILLALSKDLIGHMRNKSEADMQMEADFSKAYRLLVKGIQLSNKKEKFYPDANSTLRLTYGTVSPLPADTRNDASVNYYTTLQGTVAKYVPNDHEFDMPQRLIELNNAKDFGPYADANGYMPVNFLTNNDITGGNSGSPVMNGNGELIGLAFDGNIEAMAGDVIFDDVLQKTINVDIRYVLFIIDKYAGAKHIVDEMDLVK
jgi:hypothetical protein